MKYQDLFEHEIYKNIPGTKSSYREDPGNTNTTTQKHAHTYAKPKGKGEQMYSVNMDGTGHDGSKGIEIPQSHAEYFRGLGYKIDDSNILENVNVFFIDPKKYSLVTLPE